MIEYLVPLLYMGQSIKNGASEICGGQPLNNMKGYGLLKQT